MMFICHSLLFCQCVVETICVSSGVVQSVLTTSRSHSMQRSYCIFKKFKVLISYLFVTSSIIIISNQQSTLSSVRIHKNQHCHLLFCTGGGINQSVSLNESDINFNISPQIQCFFVNIFSLNVQQPCSYHCTCVLKI